VNGGHEPKCPTNLVKNFRRPFSFGVFGRRVFIDNEPEQLSREFRIRLVSGSNFFPASSTRSAQERIMFFEPLFSLNFGALAVAGVGRKSTPRGGKTEAALGIFGGGRSRRCANFPRGRKRRWPVRAQRPIGP